MSSSGYAMDRSEPLSVEPVGAPPQSAVRPQVAAGEWRYCAASMMILAVAYLLLQNGHWIPGTDTSFYISVSRNVALGKGFTFNGGPVGKIPPLWPAALALATKISTSFWFLNLIPTCFLVIAAGFWYWILRRLAEPRKCLWSVVLSGLLFFAYTGAVQLRTEAMFCFMLAPAILLAMQVSEGRSGRWRIVLMLVLVALSIGVRWAGVVTSFIVAGALIAGQLRIQRNRQFAAVAMVALVTVGTFVSCRLLLRYVFPPPPMEWTDPEDRKGNRLKDDADLMGASGPEMQKIFGEKGFRAMAHSLLGAGKWISSVFWFPCYLGVTNATIGIFTDIFGWGLILLTWYVAFVDARNRRQWIWIGMILYCGAIIARCRVPNPRYLVPVAPLLLLGVWLGLERLAIRLHASAWQRVFRVSVPLLLCSIALCNIGLWTIDAYIFRASNFYERYKAGEVDKLIAAARTLVMKGAQDKEIAVSLYYTNLGREKPRPNGEGLRTMNMLTNLLTRSVPDNVCTGKPNEKLLRWAAHKKPEVKYYLYRPEVSPWRALHFRIGWLQKKLQHRDFIPDNPSWVLYDLSAGTAKKIDLPEVGDWPTHLPQMPSR